MNADARKLGYHVMSEEVTLIHPESWKSQTLAAIWGWWNKQVGRPGRELEYPQGWNHMPHNFLRTPIKMLCGVLGGHEISKTEWGYGGGFYADRHCRWCDCLIQVPKDGNVWSCCLVRV